MFRKCSVVNNVIDSGCRRKVKIDKKMSELLANERIGKMSLFLLAQDYIAPSLPSTVVLLDFIVKFWIKFGEIDYPFAFKLIAAKYSDSTASEMLCYLNNRKPIVLIGILALIRNFILVGSELNIEPFFQKEAMSRYRGLKRHNNWEVAKQASLVLETIVELTEDFSRKVDNESFIRINFLK